MNFGDYKKEKNLKITEIHNSIDGKINNRIHKTSIYDEDGYLCKVSTVLGVNNKIDINYEHKKIKDVDVFIGRVNEEIMSMVAFDKNKNCIFEMEFKSLWTVYKYDNLNRLICVISSYRLVSEYKYEVI